MKNKDNRNIFGMGPLDKIYVLVHIPDQPKADNVYASGFEVIQLGILIRDAERHGMNKIDAADNILFFRPYRRWMSECD